MGCVSAALRVVAMGQGGDGGVDVCALAGGGDFVGGRGMGRVGAEGDVEVDRVGE